MKIKTRQKVSLFLAFFLLACFLGSAAAPKVKYKRLFDFIEQTAFVDVHAHPDLGHVAFDPKNPYPTLEPPISRPYWAVRKGRIAVFDSLEPVALKAIYGYEKDDVTDTDLAQLEALSQKYWASWKLTGFNRLLDICGIERVFSNSDLPLQDADPNRVFWVPSVDNLLYPLDPAGLKAIDPRLKDSLGQSFKDVAETSEKYKTQIRDIWSYLALVDALIADHKNNHVVALKFASAYIRTLWFDDPESGDVATIFAQGLSSKLTDWESYKKVQDFIARHIFLKAGELGLPVHFHTGFGAVAGLKNLDANPLNLESVFSDIRYKDTRFLILHAGYPWWDKLKPLLEKRNVSVEFSAVNWMVYEHELAAILFDWLCYPGAAEKIMFGSDAGAPVFFWIAAKNSRLALYDALARLIETNIINEDKAVLIAEKVMRTNALRFHS